MRRLAWRLLTGCLPAALAGCTGTTASTATPVPLTTSEHRHAGATPPPRYGWAIDSIDRI
jgi:hypothetical protein